MSAGLRLKPEPAPLTKELPPASSLRVRERPILFRPEFVRAILDGRKTQTRRLVKPQPSPDPGGTWSWDYRKASSQLYGREPNRAQMLIHSPHRTGDSLWVRETWRRAHAALPGYEYLADQGTRARRPSDFGWRPSIHMPRAACRLVLEVTSVRVERLQDITDRDIEAEGVRCMKHNAPPWNDFCRPRSFFEETWDSIHGAGAWDANPWVWAITFRRTSL